MDIFNILLYFSPAGPIPHPNPPLLSRHLFSPYLSLFPLSQSSVFLTSAQQQRPPPPHSSFSELPRPPSLLVFNLPRAQNHCKHLVWAATSRTQLLPSSQGALVRSCRFPTMISPILVKVTFKNPSFSTRSPSFCRSFSAISGHDSTLDWYISVPYLLSFTLAFEFFYFSPLKFSCDCSTRA